MSLETQLLKNLCAPILLAYVGLIERNIKNSKDINHQITSTPLVLRPANSLFYF